MFDRINGSIALNLIIATISAVLGCSYILADDNPAIEVNGDEPQILEVIKIWDEAPHNAFTGLTRFKGKWFCTFREATNHGSMDGRIRIITSENGEEWESSELFEVEGCDLRDPKIYVTPDDNLLLLTRRRWP